MTSEELAAFRELVVAELEKHKIAVAHPPVCIITATDLESRRDSRGRRYPWGNALSERPGSSHAELPALRRFLLEPVLLSSARGGGLEQRAPLEEAIPVR